MSYVPMQGHIVQNKLGPLLYSYGGAFAGYNRGETFSMDTSSHNLSRLGQSDTGGYFSLTRDKFDVEPCVSNHNGSLALLSPTMTWPVLGPALTDSQLRGLGTTAIARSTPTTPAFSGTNAVIELYRDGIPSMVGASAWKDRTALHRGIASEHLNYQFGWKPLVNDIRGFAHAVRNSSQILRDFREGSGKNHRVGLNIASSKTTTASPAGAAPSFVDGQNNARSYAPGAWHTSVGSETWFSGCFTYFVPDGNNFGARLERYESLANHLLGTRITPEVIWNAAPWSWALDWFGNIGDILHNVSNLGNDGTVLKWGYVMHHNFAIGHVNTFYRMDKLSSTNFYEYRPSSCTRTRETKIRLKASPYYFFANSGNLTVRQASILAAIGLTRLG